MINLQNTYEEKTKLTISSHRIFRNHSTNISRNEKATTDQFGGAMYSALRDFLERPGLLWSLQDNDRFKPVFHSANLFARTETKSSSEQIRPVGNGLKFPIPYTTQSSFWPRKMRGIKKPVQDLVSSCKE